mgnify:CR=1 FL=1
MIDWKQVNRLRTDVGIDAFDEIIELFINEVEGILERLRDRPNYAEMENDMHALKGSTLNLGFQTLSELCKKGEKLSADRNPKAVNLPEIDSCFQISKSKFTTELPNAIMDEC